MFRREGMYISIKRILLLVAVLLTAMLQNTDGLLPVFFGLRFFPLVPLTVCIAMFEGEISGMLYGMAAGCFWDVCSSGADGYFGFCLALVGAVTGILVHYFMRNKLLTQYCITSVSAVLISVFSWLFTVYIPMGDSGCSHLLMFFLPSAVITVMFSFISYYFVKIISEDLFAASR